MATHYIVVYETVLHVLLTQMLKEGGAQKYVLKQAQKDSGVLGLPAVARLPYFDLVKDVLLDGMHIQKNNGTVICRMMMGEDFGEKGKNLSKALGIHKNLTRATNPKQVSNYANMMSAVMQI
jgi:hypothetical protein